MTDLIKRCYFTDLFPAWYFYFLGFLLFLFFLFLLSFLLLEFNAEIGKLQLDHIVHHLLDLVLNLRKNSLFYLLQLRLILGAGLILPFFCMLIDLLLHDQHCFGRTASWIFFLEFILLCQFLLLFALTLFFLLCLGEFLHHLKLLGCWRDFDFILLVIILDCIRYLRELVSLHSFTYPKSSISQHLLLQGLLPFLI